MTATFPPPWGRSQDKIRAEALDRAAVVYVRQSTRQQVAEHGESTRLQYALVERAVALGWARSRIEVIDDDLGQSAAVAETRPGFAKLVTEVTMGRVGLVLGVEMSRLARTGRDWHQLIGAPRSTTSSCGGETTPPPGRRSGRVEAGGSLIRGSPGRVEAASTTSGRAGTARRPGFG